MIIIKGIIFIPVVEITTLELPVFPMLSVAVQVCVPESTALRYCVLTVADADCPRTKHSPEQVEVHVYTTAPIGGLGLLLT